mmetsp:Transcript_55750/g.92665  ORF Transcript_55750/g.92665 Transcript_55750/m.92665 type:complete len:88 (+) Transcript_55750:125-388(+)
MTLHVGPGKDVLKGCSEAACYKRHTLSQGCQGINNVKPATQIVTKYSALLMQLPRKMGAHKQSAMKWFLRKQPDCEYFKTLKQKYCQ